MNLIEALDQKGIRWKQSGRPNNIWLCCPFCSDTRFRLGVDVFTGQGHCFNCEWRPPGPKLALVALQKKLTLGEWEIQAEQVTTRKLAPIRMPTDFQQLDPKDTEFWMKKAYRYVKGRGVTQQQIKRYRIGLSLSGTYAYRVVVPIYYEKKLVGIVSRALKDSQIPKYKNSVGDKALFGHKTPERSKCILVEGMFDALACDRAVGDSFDCYGILGHSLTGRQLDMLTDYTEFVIWPDPDKAGVNGFSVIGNQLKSLGKVKIVLPLQDRDDSDPADLSDDEIRSRVNTSKGWSQTIEQSLKMWLVYGEG